MNEATAGSNALALKIVEETEIKQETSLIEEKAKSVTVDSDTGFTIAGELTKQVKRMQKQVVDAWEPLRKSTYEAYTTVNKNKTQMLAPLESAEKILKKKMGDYSMEMERKRRAQEEAMRRLARQESERMLAEAAAAETAGKNDEAEYHMAEAEVMEDVSVGGKIAASAPKTAGVSQSKSWKIVGIDSSKVPVAFGGEEIRPVDERVVMRLIKESKGTVQIPGVQYEETVSISVRS